LACTMDFNYTDAAALWLKPLDLCALSDAEFKKAYTELATDFKTDPTSEAIKLWAAAYKRESLRRKIKKASEKVASLEDSICNHCHPYYIVAQLDEDLGSELMNLVMLFGDLEASGPETAEGAESPELQTKRLALIQTEKKCIDTLLSRRWRDNTDVVIDYHNKTLEKLRAKKATLIAEIKTML
jgi:hypothetical protein